MLIHLTCVLKRVFTKICPRCPGKTGGQPQKIHPWECQVNPPKHMPSLKLGYVCIKCIKRVEKKVKQKYVLSSGGVFDGA